MRPLPVRPMTGVPASVQGLALVRGCPTPVIDASSLLGGEPSRPTRFVTVKTGPRRLALAVDSVVGVFDIPAEAIDALPPLFHSAGLEAVEAIGALDSELLLLLRSACLVPDEIWATIHASGPTA